MWPTSTVFCFLVLHILNLEAFKLGEDGVCIAKIR